MCVLHCGVHTACISSKLTANKNTLRTAKQGEHPAYYETRRTPCVLRNKNNSLRTAKPMVMRHRKSFLFLKAYANVHCFSFYNIKFSCIFSCVASFRQCGFDKFVAFYCVCWLQYYNFSQDISSPQHAVAWNQHTTHRPLPVAQRAVCSAQFDMSALRLKTGLYERSS